MIAINNTDQRSVIESFYDSESDEDEVTFNQFKFKLEKQIGVGSFGKVMQGIDLTDQ